MDEMDVKGMPVMGFTFMVGVLFCQAITQMRSLTCLLDMDILRNAPAHGRAVAHNIQCAPRELGHHTRAACACRRGLRAAEHAQRWGTV
jgi:hypothetical protein